MGQKTNYWSQAVLELLFNATTIANIAENASVSPITNIYVSLHTADPGVGGNQTTSEAAYTGYARQAVARTTGGWSISGEQISPVSNINFPSATAGSETETYVGLGTALSGAGELLYRLPLTSAIVISGGVTPVLTPSSFVGES